MKNSIAALQIVAAILITGSVAFAMEPPKQQVSYNDQISSEQPAEITPVAAPEAPQIVVEPEPTVAPPAAQTQAVEPPAPSAPASHEEIMAAAGIAPSDYGFVEFILAHESGWCATKWQGEIGGCPAYHGVPDGPVGYGLCQSTPAIKMASAGAGWESDPVVQLRWCANHAELSHGGWANSYQYWLVHSNW